MSSQSLQLGRGKMIRKSATATTRPSKSASQRPSQPALRATSNAAPTTTQLPFEQPQDDQHPTAHNLETSSTPAELKKTRGKTTGKGMIEMIASNGNKKVEIIFDQEHWVPNTEYSNKKFTTAIGIEVRSRAPVCYRGWNKIPANIKRTLREGLTVHFDVEIEHQKIIYFVDDKMRSSYTQFKWKLHDHYQKCGTPARGRATLPPPDLWRERSTEEWHWLCDKLYTDPKYIDKCEKNSASRKRQRSTHRGGAMPFIQHALRTAKEGNPLSFIDNWAAMYQDSNSNWVSDDARDKYDRLKNKREEHKEKLTLEAPEGTPQESVQVNARDEIPIMAEECGRKGKRVRGLGSFPRMELPTATSSTAVSSEMNVMHDKVKKLESTVDTMRSQNAQLMTMLKKFLMNGQGCFADTENIDMNIVVPNSEEDDVFGRDEDGVQNNGDNSETEDLEEDL